MEGVQEEHFGFFLVDGWRNGRVGVFSLFGGIGAELRGICGVKSVLVGCLGM